MDQTVLKKRLNTYKSSEGRLNNIDDEVVIDVLRAWEQWQGSSAELYRELGLSKMQLVTIIQKAKKLVKEGALAGSDFKEVKVEPKMPSGEGYGIEVSLGGDKLVRFSEVTQLVEFLKAVEQK